MHRRVLPVLATLTLAAGAAIAQPQVVEPHPLIPRDVLFGNPERAAPQLSPDGKWISYLAPVDGVLNVWAGPVDKPAEAKPVTADKKRGIRQYFWAYTNQHILYLQDEGGNENWNVHVVEVATGKDVNLISNDKVAARVEGVSDKFPDEILVGINERNPQLHDLVRINIRTGERKVVLENPGFVGFVSDDNFVPRLASSFNQKGEMEYFKMVDGKPQPWQTIPSEDSLTTGPAGFDKTGNILYMTDSRGRDTGALFALDLTTGEKKLIAENPKCDAGGTLTHPTEKTVQAVAFNYTRTEWTVLDESIRADLDYLKTVRDGEVNIADRTLDDRRWLVAYTIDNGPAYVYLYDRPGNGQAGKATYLFTNRPALESVKLARMHPVVIKSRDGLDLVSYLSVPSWLDPDNDMKPAQPIPMVLFVHGGPWARDDWGYDADAQWLANRGYAVLQVNFRGSTGFGKNFLNAGNRQWAAAMHDDLLDAVQWAVDQNIADKDKIAIFGGSYGGYAALVGVTFTPDVFACGVSVVGPSNIITLLNTIPAYWGPLIEVFKTRVGDHTTEEGRKFLDSRSPLNFIERITRPLLIGQGANDPRVKQSESDQIVSAMQRKNIPVSYILFPDEGHGFARPENRTAFNAVTEAFLSKHLGGRFEPFGDSLKKSSIKVPAGAEFVPSLQESMPAASALTK